MPDHTSSSRQYVVPCLLFAAISIFYTIAACFFPMVYIWATYEDLFGEWVQFWSVMIAMAVAVRLVFIRSRFRWFFGLLALSCLYVGMEEISWGQRIFGFSSPTYFRANNLQGETNLHNFFTGPYGTTLKRITTYVLALALASYGLVYPAAIRLKIRMACWFEKRGVAAPPLYLWPFFAGAALLELGFFQFNEAEVAEVMVGIGLALTTVHYMYILGSHNKQSTFTDTATATVPSNTRSLLKYQGAVVVLTLMFSAGTTMAIYSSSRGAAIDRRIENGVKKFAGRYARHHAWETAITLYKRVQKNNPQSVTVLRQLAECYMELGEHETFLMYLNQALDIDLQRYKEKPRRASVNRSLTRTYRLLGDEERAQKHLQRALRIGVKRVNKQPSSAPAAYSLGKTYSLAARYSEALQHLSRAYKMNPTSKKYRKAYYAALRKVS